jgi:hypothetical protein
MRKSHASTFWPLKKDVIPTIRQRKIFHFSKRNIMKYLVVTLSLLAFAASSKAALIRVEFESTVNEIYVARPVGSGYEFDRDLDSSNLAGQSIFLGDEIRGIFVYDTLAAETSYSKGLNDPTYASYYGLKSFELKLGALTLANPDDEDYLAIYDDGLFSGVDSFYTSGSYRDDINFNIFNVYLFSDPDLWSTLSIPDELNLDDFYYKKISGAFLPNTSDVHLNWSGDITSLRSSYSVPEPPGLLLAFSAFTLLLAFYRRRHNKGLLHDAQTRN